MKNPSDYFSLTVFCVSLMFLSFLHRLEWLILLPSVAWHLVMVFLWEV